jgi:hypothetical protein
MIAAFVLLAQLVGNQPLLPAEAQECGETAIQTTMKLNDDLQLTVSRDVTGRPLRAVVKRFDGKPMTCEPFFAWIAHDFSCGQGCSNPYTANGHAGGSSRFNSCTNARQDGCAQTACAPSTYEYCATGEKFSGTLLSGGGECTYYQLNNCVINDNCSDWY